MKKTTVFVWAMIGLTLPIHAGGFRREAAFDSVAAFVAKAKAFRPAASKGDLSSLFVMAEEGEENHGHLVTAQFIESCAVIWSGDDSALLLVIAGPPTIDTRSQIGVLFLLVRRQQQWRIADLRRFTAAGKDADIAAELTADAGHGYRLGTGGMSPVVTIKESHGGRGYKYQSSASYTLSANKLKRLELE